MVVQIAALALVMHVALVSAFLGDPTAHVNRLGSFWSWSRFLHIVPTASLIYDPRVLYAVLRNHVSAHSHYLPFAYPPTFLLLIWPLAMTSPQVSLPLWLGSGLLLYAWACWERTQPLLGGFVILAAPSTVAALY
jgi:hypothetical protein